MTVRVEQRRPGSPAEVPAGAYVLVVRAAFGGAEREYVITQGPSEPGPNGWDEARDEAGAGDCCDRTGRACPADVHLSVGLERAVGTRWPAHADVLCQERPEPAGWAARSVDRILHWFPGCLVASVRETHGGCVMGTRGGARVMAAPVGGKAHSLTERECSGIASFLHAVLVHGHAWAEVGSVRISVPAAAGGPQPEERTWTPVALSRLSGPGGLAASSPDMAS